MSESRDLRRLLPSHHLIAREIYCEAIEIEDNLYTQDQVNAWSSLALLPGVLDLPLQDGKGWISLDKGVIEAFALRYPLNRLALLYCRGRSHRKGHATSLINRIELEAIEEGKEFLCVEASLYSYQLFLRLGWKLIKPQIISIAGIVFKRYLMKKNFSIK